ncbi:MAG: hypothetical protein HY775_06510 [Acidobacteria bacterium]|nr:hypothetical protein [Acidobacteriota bacterium]
MTRRDGAVTRRRVRDLMSDTGAEALLAGAVAKGLLVRTGQRGGVRYVLSDEVVMRAGAAGLEAQSRKRQMLLDEIHRRGSLSTAEGACPPPRAQRSWARTPCSSGTFWATWSGRNWR